MTRPEWIEVGRVSRAHGVHGEVRVLPSSDNPDRFQPGSVVYSRPERDGVAGPRVRDKLRLTVSSLRGGDDFPIVAFEGVADRDAAEALRGHILEIRSDQLPDLEGDEFYPFDLIGLTVRDERGTVRGTVVDAVESPAHDLLVVRLEEESGAAAPQGAPPRPVSRETLVPFITEAVPEIELAEGYLVVTGRFLT